MSTRAGDLRWLRKAEHWGEWIRFSDTEIAPPESIWMLKATDSPKVRFYAIGKGQVGPEHAHVVAATCWAYANRWIRPDNPIGDELACRAEVMAGGTERPA